MLMNIKCKYKEYRKNDDGNWKLYAKSDVVVNNNFIQSMVNSSPYFSNMGGYMKSYYKNSRKFGLVVDKVVSVSFCGKVKKVLRFDYNTAVDMSELYGMT